MCIRDSPKGVLPQQIKKIFVCVRFVPEGQNSCEEAYVTNKVSEWLSIIKSATAQRLQTIVQKQNPIANLGSDENQRRLFMEYRASKRDLLQYHPSISKTDRTDRFNIFLKIVLVFFWHSLPCMPGSAGLQPAARFFSPYSAAG